MRARIARAGGVTLIELMTVIVVIAVLASIAVPSYRNYLLRSQRTDATTALLRIQAAQEKFYLQNNQYSCNLTAAPPTGLGLSDQSENGFYDLGFAAGCGGNAFTVEATPRAGGGQTDDDKCTEFTINESGVRDATGSASDPVKECWR